MPKKKRPLSPKTYAIVERAVDEGIAYGITRLFKHHDDDTITEQGLRERSDAIHAAIMNALCEVVRFDEDA
jgi:hypothetical protein